jgi:hypothetical protein
VDLVVAKRGEGAGLIPGEVHVVDQVGTGNNGGPFGSCTLRRFRDGLVLEDSPSHPKWIRTSGLAVAGACLRASIVHLACLAGCSCEVVSLLLAKLPEMASKVDALGRTPLAVACEVRRFRLIRMVLCCLIICARLLAVVYSQAGSPNGVIVALGHAFPLALSGSRSLIRAAAAKCDLAVFQAFAPAAAVVFEEYSQWRLESGRDIEYRPTVGSLPCEPLVRLLLDALRGSDWSTDRGQGREDPQEFLLGQVFDYACAS